MVPKRFTMLAILGLYLAFSSNAFADEVVVNDVNEAACAACREKQAQGLSDCFQCHFCETDKVTVKWSVPLADFYQSLALKEARSATLSIEASIPMEAPALASMGMSFPPIQMGNPSISLKTMELTPKDLKGPFKKDFVIDYKRADFSSLAGMEPMQLGNIKVTFWVCQDTNKNGKCSDEDRRVQMMPQSPAFPVCAMPHVVPFGPPR